MVNILKFSEWLQEELAGRNMIQADLARITKISTPQISRYISGKSAPSADAIDAIAEALALPPQYVMQKAGLGNSLKPKDPRHEELTYLFDQLPEERKSEFIDQLRWQVSRLTRSGE